MIPRCSSVVLHELLRGARRDLELRFVYDLCKRCQIVTPTTQHWMNAAEVLRTIRNKGHFDVNKMRELAFDVLIALSACSIGAVLITSNESDFQTIRRYISFHAIYWN